jgi:hypothetical protein
MEHIRSMWADDAEAGAAGGAGARAVTIDPNPESRNRSWWWNIENSLADIKDDASARAAFNDREGPLTFMPKARLQEITTAFMAKKCGARANDVVDRTAASGGSGDGGGSGGSSGDGGGGGGQGGGHQRPRRLGLVLRGGAFRQGFSKSVTVCGEAAYEAQKAVSASVEVHLVREFARRGWAVDTFLQVCSREKGEERQRKRETRST